MNAWLLLILAGLCEIGWPLGLKWAQSGLWRLPGFITAGVCMLVSGALLFMAQKHIPIGTAYAVWTGIGAAGTFLAGALLFGDPIQPLRHRAHHRGRGPAQTGLSVGTWNGRERGGRLKGPAVRHREEAQPGKGCDRDNGGNAGGYGAAAWLRASAPRPECPVCGRHT